MSTSSVTVVIPTHDRLPMLRAAVDSVRRQRTVDAELIVVDDASSDGTPDWLATQHDPRLTWRRVEPGGGGSAARNLGLELVSTPLVLFLDDDDLLRPGALATLTKALGDAPAAAGAAGAYVRFGPAVASQVDPHPSSCVVAPTWIEELVGWNMPPAALLWRTEVVRRIGGWDTELRRCEDRDLNLRAYPRSFVLVPEVVMEYRVHGAQVTGDPRAETHMMVLHRFIDTLPDRDAATARRVLVARRHLEMGLAQHREGDFRAAARALWTVRRVAPEVVRSPILRDWLRPVFAKCALAALAPAMARRVRGFET